jgi:hypothetical protein
MPKAQIVIEDALEKAEAPKKFDFPFKFTPHSQSFSQYFPEEALTLRY